LAVCTGRQPSQHVSTDLIGKGEGGGGGGPLALARHARPCGICHAISRPPLAVPLQVMSRRSGKQHLNEKMAKDTKRVLGNMVVLNPANINNAIKCMPNSGIGH
jgi:ribosomal protein L35